MSLVEIVKKKTHSNLSTFESRKNLHEYLCVRMITVPDIKPVSISPKMIMVHNDVMVGQIIRRTYNFLSIAISKESRTGQF